MDGAATSPDRYCPVNCGTIKMTAFSTGLNALNDSSTLKKNKSINTKLTHLPLVSRVCEGACPVITFWIESNSFQCSFRKLKKELTKSIKFSKKKLNIFLVHQYHYLQA